MKTLHKLLSAILICAIATSCSTTQKIQVFGTSGTQIYSPGKTKLATIDYSGKAQIELDSDAYYAYLLAKSDGSDDYVPFALDYKNYSYAGSKFALGLGYALAGTGAGTAAIGTIAMAATAINGDDDLTETFGLISAAGLGLGLVGVAIGMPADQCLSQIDHDYQFKYLKNQTTNEDLSLYFTTPTFTSSPRVPTEPIAAEKPAAKTEKAATTAEASSKSKKSFSSSKSTKSFNDFAAKIQGTYVGKGKLTLNSNTVESYTDIVIKIKRIDKTSVEVSVIESNGSEFFSEPAVYDIIHDIKNGANNSFKLINKEISSATITIDANKKCTYIHPRVNIDGDIYQLSITATLQQ